MRPGRSAPVAARKRGEIRSGSGWTGAALAISAAPPLRGLAEAIHLRRELVDLDALDHLIPRQAAAAPLRSTMYPETSVSTELPAMKRVDFSPLAVHERVEHDRAGRAGKAAAELSETAGCFFQPSKILEPIEHRRSLSTPGAPRRQDARKPGSLASGVGRPSASIRFPIRLHPLLSWLLTAPHRPGKRPACCSARRRFPARSGRCFSIASVLTKKCT